MQRTRNYPMRSLFRELYSAFFLMVARVVVGKIVPFSRQRLRSRIGHAGVLHIAAPGASVAASDKAFAADPDASDVLGINYFSECHSLALWDKATVFVIEPHKLYKRYLESVSQVVKSKGQCILIVKGHSSPKKFLSSLIFLKALSKIPRLTLMLSSDRYLADLGADFPRAVMANPDRVVSGAKSLHWALSYGFVMGYRKIVLHGIDFSTTYIYETSTDPRSQLLPPNTWVSDERSRDKTVNDIVALRDLFLEQGVQLAHLGCVGPVSEILPLDHRPVEEVYAR